MSLDKLVGEINKKQGKGVAIVGNEYRLKTPVICSTGSLALDMGLGCQGLPEGRILEYYGPPSGGKSTLSIISMIEAQKKGSNVAYLDLENTFDRQWFENLGGDSEKLIYITPESGSQTFTIAETLIKSKEIDFIVIDSVSAMATSSEIEADYDDAMMAQLARLMSMGLKKLNNVMLTTKCKTSVLFINQVRSGIGPFAPPEVRGGGKSLDFYASIIVSVRRKEVIGDKNNPDGFITKLEVKKNKCGRPFQIVETNLYIGKDGKFGIDKNEEVIDVAMSQGIIQRCKKDKDEDGNEIYVQSDTGKSYKFNDIVVAGKQKFIDYIMQEEKIFEQIKKEIENIFLVQDTPEPGSFNDKVNEEIAEQENKEKNKREKRIKKEDENDNN